MPLSITALDVGTTGQCVEIAVAGRGDCLRSMIPWGREWQFRRHGEPEDAWQTVETDAELADALGEMQATSNHSGRSLIIVCGADRDTRYIAPANRLPTLRIA